MDRVTNLVEQTVSANLQTRVDTKSEPKIDSQKLAILRDDKYKNQDKNMLNPTHYKVKYKLLDILMQWIVN